MPNDKIVPFPGVTRLDIPPERVLCGALENVFDKVVVLGYTEEGEEYFASSVADGGDILWLLERAKQRLMTVGDTHE